MAPQVDIVVQVTVKLIISPVYGLANIPDELTLGHFVLYVRTAEVHREHNE